MKRAATATRALERHSLLVVSLFGLALTFGVECSIGGGPADEGASPPSAHESEIEEASITESDRDHWAWLPIERPAVPEVEQSEWCRNEIDRFVLQALERDDRSPQPPAAAARLLRRLTFDLHGLPPTLEQLAAAPQTPMEAEQLIDRLLASPAYGEHAAQAWLDLARFAETDGFEHDKVRQGAWQYRDWVIQALNAGMPYDQFLRQQLAGDLLPGGAPIATQFVLAGPDMPDINEQDLRRHDKLNELTGTIGAVVLGLQLQCAQCHDHKYDPISQADFYRFRAIFEPAVPPMKRDRHVLRLTRTENAPPARLYHRGELQGAGVAVPPGVPRIAVAAGESHRLAHDAPRLQFCEWLCDRQNPLTARVIANRLWQSHFGYSLTENPSDFGVVAGGPSHPELLDWLAAELVDNGWDLKLLHRRILTSAAYQQAGAFVSDESPAADLELLTHFPRRRLTGEAIRDALLAISGQIHFQSGGPSVLPPLPPELTGTLLKGQWKTSPLAADHARRSIYVFARRNLRYPLFDAFDRPDAGASCPRRNRSTTAIQSLHLLNSDFTFQAAQQTATNLLGRVAPEANSAELVDTLFRLCLSRPADASERAWLVDFLGERSKQSESELHTRFTTLALAIFNCNEFIYID